jgi:hypothetical protein
VDNPYPPDFINSISYPASADNLVQIIHIRMDIKSFSPVSLKFTFESDRSGGENYAHHFHR